VPRDTADDCDIPGAFEQLVLLAVARLGEGAYGMTVRQEIDERSGRSVSLGAVYATLGRLEEKGYVSSYAAAGGPERSGRARRFVKIERAGTQALRRALDVLDRMRLDVPELSPAGLRR